jgi:hypothetical protein
MARSSSCALGLWRQLPRSGTHRHSQFPRLGHHDRCFGSPDDGRPLGVALLFARSWPTSDRQGGQSRPAWWVAHAACSAIFSTSSTPGRCPRRCRSSSAPLSSKAWRPLSRFLQSAPCTRSSAAYWCIASPTSGGSCRCWWTLQRFPAPICSTGEARQPLVGLALSLARLVAHFHRGCAENQGDAPGHRDIHARAPTRMNAPQRADAISPGSPARTCR